jgi:EAL domain-containing protein (putative c-di-GMP-specific phosphodiesterase class I)
VRIARASPFAARSPYNGELGMDPQDLVLEDEDEESPASAGLAAGTAPPAFAKGTREEAAATPVVDLVDLEARFDRCLAHLAMHYQPIVHASDRRRFGYEALLRSSDRSLPHPGAILDAAERLERTGKLGRMIRAQIAGVFANAPADRGVVFVNLHVDDLFDKALSSPFSPLTKIASRVVLEITERSSLDGLGDLRFRLAELREVGYRIAIDDLGGGHARMGSLAPLDTDFVKLDMAVVRGCDTHPTKQQLARAIIRLCAEHGMMVVGEGVETEAEARTLTDLGCDLLQGYLIARPGPPFVDP